MTKKREKRLHINLNFEEALRPFVQTNPTEITDDIERIRTKQEEIRESVKKKKESINQGARRAKVRFRP
jgi:hypothetical protein